MRHAVKYCFVKSSSISVHLRVPKQLGSTYHVSAIDWRGHLDLPEVLPLRQLLVPTDSSSATAVLHVEVHLAVVTGQEGCSRFVHVIPHPLKVCSEKKTASLGGGAIWDRTDPEM